ncbi:MAG: hypothetical protein AAB515_01650 [Patescibacteria group bacterium]
MKVSEIGQLVKGAETLLSQGVAEKDAFLKDLYFKSSIAFSWFGLEGFISLAFSDFISLKSLELHERAFLSEQKLEYSNGNFVISGTKYLPTRDKLIFLLKRFGNYNINNEDLLWANLRNVEDWRNSLVHPKAQQSAAITKKHAQISLDTIKSVISLVYKKVYKKTARF